MVGFDTAMSADLQSIRVISFDAEGTLASHAFSRTIWQEVVPALYADRHGLELEAAAQRVFAEYASIGPGRREWYDIGYWFRRLELGEPSPVIEAHRSLIEVYSDVAPVLDALRERFVLIVASSTPHEFLQPLLRDVEHAFVRMFSSTSACGRLKDEEFYRWMCREVGVEPGEVAHVGDNRVRDYESASSAGLVALHLDRSGQCGSALHSLAELPEHLGMPSVESV
jgi:putative hydrolase of the HAD superfamily